MSILYSCYARGTEIVAETGSQKFKKLVKVLLERVEPRARKSYEHEQYGHRIRWHFLHVRQHFSIFFRFFASHKRRFTDLGQCFS
jgi:hypothetical protein